MGEGVDQLGVLEERLAWYAAPIQADAADTADSGAVVLLDDGCGQAQLSGTYSGMVAAGSGADHDDVKAGFGHRECSCAVCALPF